MIYKFKSRDAADVIMLGPNGDHVLRLLGREPSAKGIIEPADMPAAIAALEQAVLADEADTERRRDEAEQAGEAAPQAVVTLRQRVWPLIEMMRQCHRDGQPIVWGV
ncbi:MAG TPA: DUF1840 domain-containing protein [Azohydromonas sp.]|nr:DUF1840 domain-containing protein [Azohydromonas sp.]